jgi:PAS domain S-box-containing protein/diguanylate cyclase (GGDEF)-like protein
MAYPTAAAAGAGAAPRSLASRLKHLLPQGQTLPYEAWAGRHRVLLGLLWSNAVGITVFALAQGFSLAHSLAEGTMVASFALGAVLVKRRRRLAAVMVSLGLVTASALLVHIWGGVIEGHFYFFVVIVVLALYEDWIPFLLAAAYVVLHHGLMGTLDPGAVYNHPDAVAHPWKWAAIHGAFVTAAGIGSVAAWRLNENVRAETSKAYHQARESEERFKGAFEGAPIGMVLHTIDAQGGRLLQVNRAMCDITGYSEDELVGKSLVDITHAEDVQESAALIEGLVDGGIDRFQLEKRYRHADGHAIWTLVHGSVVFDDTRRPAYVIGQVQDITDRKRAHEALAYEARHDALTGLRNRRSLMADLEQGLVDASREQPLLLVLFDLDGFKAYNDVFGHPAGDTLLTRLGHNLAETVEDWGSAYRMGGDEFCVLARLHGDGSTSMAEVAADALSARGDGFSIAASYGSVLVPTETNSSAEALRIADQRMYARKSMHSRASAGRQTTDVLVRVLAERSPALGTHLDEVTELCHRVANRLMLSEDQVASLLQAASLHDVGKAAIPDEILDKPGPLTDEEWGFMRRHPVVGERILSVAPALVQAAKLVRSSHERFDGRGYPDRLSGDDIPMGARIIFVCDSYNAMTSDRPYRDAMSAEEALAELRGCAGAQFDPVVVDAFLAVISERGVSDGATQLLAGHGPALRPDE